MSDVEIKLSEAKPPSKRGGHRLGAGRPSKVRLNNERIEQGLEPLDFRKGLNKKAPKRKSDAILPVSKKARAQEILAEMLTRKGQYVVKRILDKALDDGDKDQLECLKIVIDRILPKDYINKVKSSNQIQINISNVGDVVEVQDVIEAEFEDAE